MKPEIDDDFLRQLISQTPYIDDEGFTDSVLSQLPKPRSLVMTRTTAIITSMLVALLLVGFFSPLPAQIARGWLDAWVSQTPWTSSAIVLIVATAATVWTSFAATFEI